MKLNKTLSLLLVAQLALFALLSSPQQRSAPPARSVLDQIGAPAAPADGVALKARIGELDAEAAAGRYGVSAELLSAEYATSVSLQVKIEESAAEALIVTLREQSHGQVSVE